MSAREGNLAESERHLALAASAAPNDARSIEELVAVTSAMGNTQKAKAFAQQGVTRFPLSLFLREELGDPDLKLLANDSTRVLNLAAQYMRLGSTRKPWMCSRGITACAGRSKRARRTFPGNHSMLVYFRGYCRERLGTTCGGRLSPRVSAFDVLCFSQFR